MPPTERNVLEIPPGYRSQEAASFMAQLDDQSRLLLHDLEGITPAELEWQPSPGMNSIGMLLAHIAIVEVLWTQVGPEGKPYDIESVIGLGLDGDGMPIAPEGTPPAALAGKDLSFYRDLLDRARAHAKRVAAGLSETDLDAMRPRTTRRGEHQENNVRWVLYHMCEHFSGHYGQILLLRHMYRAAKSPVGT